MRSWLSLVFVLCILFFMSAFASAQDVPEEPLPDQNTTVDVPVDNSTVQEPVPEVDVTPEAAPVATSQVREVPAPDDVPEPKDVLDFTIADFIPNDFKVGDVQFNIRVKNTGNLPVSDLAAFVSGKGFSTIDVVGIDSLAPGESSYIIVQGNFKERGSINLTIKVDGKVFYQKVMVIDPDYVADAGRAEALRSAELAKEALIGNLTSQVDALDVQYAELEAMVKQKKSDGYDVTDVSLTDLKGLVRDAEASLLVSDVDRAKSSMKLAGEEYAYQKRKLDEATKIKKSFFESFRNNLLVISSTVGAVVTIFAFIELMKKKKESLGNKVMKVRVSFDRKKNNKADGSNDAGAPVDAVKRNKSGKSGKSSKSGKSGKSRKEGDAGKEDKKKPAKGGRGPRNRKHSGNDKGDIQEQPKPDGSSQELSATVTMSDK